MNLSFFGRIARAIPGFSAASLRVLACVLPLMAVATTRAQMHPPGSPPTAGYVKFDGQPAAVKGLVYSGSEKPTPSSPAGTQYAQFALSIEYDPGNDWELTGEYEWAPLWSSQFGQSQPAFGKLLVKGNGTGPTDVGAAYAPGVYEVTCSVQVRKKTDSGDVRWVALTGNCAVIGGPLILSVAPHGYNYWGQEWGPDPATHATNSGGIQRTLGMPAHDMNDAKEPLHLQYFGFDPRGTVPVDYQVPRSQGKASCMGQPEGTVMTWSIGNQNVLAITSGGGTGSLSVDVIAIGAGSATITCHFSLNFVGMNGNASECTLDNTTSTPISQEQQHIMLQNTFNSHIPTTLTQKHEKDWRPVNYTTEDPVGSGNWSIVNNWTLCGKVAQMELKSQLGVVMPGVWVQERFTPPPPPWFYVNPNGGPTWSTVGLEDVTRLGTFYWDNFFLYCSPGSPVLSFTHEYWAATKSTSSGGLHVGTFEITFTPGTQPNTIGTVTHTKVN
ncbi:MAG: hypothetical protein KIT74_07225 [Fimbriimonadales bacterium]|nr:hypothetical protein [Fimbriimonadales bacterium]